MKKVLVFGNRHWPDCGPAKEFLSENGIDFVYLDITDNMINLKRFLKLRDEKPEFKEIKAAGRVGLPCIVINDGEKIIFDHNLIDLEDVKNKWQLYRCQSPVTGDWHFFISGFIWEEQFGLLGGAGSQSEYG